MTTLAEKLAALNIEIGVQQLANDVAIMTALADLAILLQAGHPALRLQKELRHNTEFLNYINTKIAKITAGGPSGDRKDH